MTLPLNLTELSSEHGSQRILTGESTTKPEQRCLIGTSGDLLELRFGKKKGSEDLSQTTL